MDHGMGKLTPGLSVEIRANRESRMLRQAACPVRGSAVGKPTRRKAGQAPHLDSIFRITCWSTPWPRRSMMDDFFASSVNYSRLDICVSRGKTNGHFDSAE